MYSVVGDVQWALGLFSLVWLTGLTFFIWRKLNSKPKKKLVDLSEEFKERCIQYVALKRYNPYQDTGGDQSFSLSLLDGKGDGVVVTSLHSRAGTRVFAKTVTGGEGEHKLSSEEAQVVKEALK